MPRALTVLALALLFAAPPALADVPPPASGPSAAERARDRDASVDRGFLMAHAETLGEGRWSINSYELFLLGVTYGFSDDFQASFTTSLPIVEDMPLLLSFAGKWAFFRSPTTVMAARAMIAWVTDTGGGDDTIGAFTGAVFVDHYLDADGLFALHGGLTVGGAFGAGFSTGGVQVVDGAILAVELGVTLGLGDSAKIYIEGQLPGFTDGEDLAFAKVVFVNYGVRFTGRTISGDVGFMRPVGDVDDPFVLGWPFVALSARFGGGE
ncbi:MAG: hypothetical protein EP329_22490 [Deltaproteobacteria bacterium]|nr:MAG: hypothetical protein EP329_22490 [Deltaproteobacteria bacterium]